MPEAKRSSRVATVLLLVVPAGGVLFGFWMTVKAHEYYYPGRLHLVIREQDSTFKVEQTGRHELSYRDDLGDLKFDVVSVEKSTRIPVERFGVLAQTVHTTGWRGHAFRVDLSGVYRLSARPWPKGAEVHLSFTNTETIARWALGGILLGGVCVALMMLLVIGMLKRSVR
jgi:hypothetical protein